MSRTFYTVVNDNEKLGSVDEPIQSQTNLLYDQPVVPMKMMRPSKEVFFGF